MLIVNKPKISHCVHYYLDMIELMYLVHGSCDSLGNVLAIFSNVLAIILFKNFLVPKPVWLGG